MKLYHFRVFIIIKFQTIIFLEMRTILISPLENESSRLTFFIPKNLVYFGFAFRFFLLWDVYFTPFYTLVFEVFIEFWIHKLCKIEKDIEKSIAYIKHCLYKALPRLAEQKLHLNGRLKTTPRENAVQKIFAHIKEKFPSPIIQIFYN